MKCPVCNGNTGVYNSRPEVDCVRRNRRCYDCGYKFRTVEIDLDMLDAGFLIQANDKLDLTEVKEAVKLLNKCYREAQEVGKQLNDFLERVSK